MCLEGVWKKSGNVLDRAQEGVLKRFGSNWNGGKGSRRILGGGQEGVWKGLEGVLKGSERSLKGAWKGPGEDVEGLWNLSARSLEGVYS